jgi:hypothetical protein
VARIGAGLASGAVLHGKDQGLQKRPVAFFAEQFLQPAQELLNQPVFLFF